MLSVQYTNKTSKEPLAPYISWINFDSNLNLSNDNPTATITNIISGGYTISFKVTISVTGSEEHNSKLIYCGYPISKFKDNTFIDDYINGNPILFNNLNQPIDESIEVSITVSNIQIEDERGNKISHFMFFVVNEQNISKEEVNTPKTWTINTDCSKCLMFGVIIPPSSSKDKKLSYPFHHDINFIKPENVYRFNYKSYNNMLISVSVNGTTYLFNNSISNYSLTINSELGTYIFYKDYFLLYSNIYYVSDVFELISINLKCNEKDTIVPIIFGYQESNFPS